MYVMTVDYHAPDAAAQVIESMQKTGFVVLDNHDIPIDLIAKSYEEWQQFFKQPEDQKLKYKFQRDFKIVQDGFFPSSTSETAKGSQIKDLKEFYHYYPCGRTPEGMSDATAELRTQLINISRDILTWLEKGLPENTRQDLSMPLVDMIDTEQQSLLRILHYPPLSEHPEGAMRAAAHEDINLITLIPAATASGLQVQDVHGRWHNIESKPNQIIINCGDMLQESSQNHYKATTHRVMNPQDQSAHTSRYSIPFFLHPRSDVRLSERYTAGSYLTERLKELGLL
ncbi:MAG: isopenicillin N synthase family dioxygenase [Oligoflexales bacterium]